LNPRTSNWSDVVEKDQPEYQSDCKRQGKQQSTRNTATSHGPIFAYERAQNKLWPSWLCPLRNLGLSLPGARRHERHRAVPVLRALTTVSTDRAGVVRGENLRRAAWKRFPSSKVEPLRGGLSVIRHRQGVRRSPRHLEQVIGLGHTQAGLYEQVAGGP